MSDISTKVPFRAVQGTEANILSKNYHEGYVYFATDTKKIYLDANGQSKMPMGGNSGIYYGKMQLTETPDENQKQFDFLVNDLEINASADSITIPNIDDLILNIPDGCFYRVVDIEGDGESALIITNKLTIAGSGTGTPGGPESLAGLVFNRITQQKVTTLADTACPIAFTVTAKDSAGELTGPGSYRLLINGVQKGAPGEVKNNNPDDPNDFNVIDVGEYLTLGENIVKIIVAMDTGGSSSTEASKTWNVTVTRIGLKWDYDFNETINNTLQPFTLNWEVTGGAGIEKTTHVIIDDYHSFTDVTTTGTHRTLTIDPTQYNLGHGTHKIEMYVTAQVGITRLTTDSIIANAFFAEEGNKNYIINCNYFKDTITQYDTIQIPIAIYSEANVAGNATVTLRENGSIVGVPWANVKNKEIKTWAYTPVNSGIQILSIQCGTSEVVLQLDVQSLGIAIEEVPGYAFKFKANEFVDNADVENWSDSISFSDKFDWINGGLKTELDDKGNTRQYVCVKAGSQMIIDYNIFGKDARETGKCFKVIFKATKCKDYDAQVLSCHDGSRGLILNAQNATFNSAGETLNIPYCEDSYIELELDITPSKKNDKRRYIRPWIDGVPAGVIYYDSADNFTVSSGNKLIIGSEDCDVYIYLIKLYEFNLSDTDHLNNFIADAPNAAEMVARYRRNDILDENGEISPTKLAKANPNCRVHMYEMSRMTMHKKDPVENCTYTQYHGSGNAVLTAEGVTVKVQGTSSAAYGLSAFNLDSDFKQGFTDTTTGEHIDTWAMSENSIPVNYFCTKVNVASAEGANNALNQEWYNRYQPYKTVVRGRNPKARDTMEFTPGVLFIKDKNKQDNDTENGGKGDNVFKDTTGYINSPYYKMYSICNMGNSKDNIEVFHDLENPLECCVENGDNQLPGQWMTCPQGGYYEGDTFVAVNLDNIDADKETLCPDGKYRLNRTLWENGMDEIYSFRYPDGIKEVKKLQPEYAEQMITGWFRFVNWMAHSNPAEKYAVQEFKDSYEGISFADEEAFNANESTKYILVDGEYIIADEFDDTQNYYIFVEAADKFNQRTYTLYVINDEKKNTHVAVDENAAFDNEKIYYRETDHIYGATNELLSEVDPDDPDDGIIIDSYEFKGYKAPGDLAKYQEDYEPLLKDLKISTYAGKYRYDTTEYRMAKMLHECEDYLCMDSVVFHYVFIERHSMVDNVAKNTFWSTEDGLVWNLTKDYDNDTADGNDNQGKLTLSYGCEPGDIDIAGTSIFNAGNSVWLKFIGGLYQACQKIYTALDVSQENRPSAWSATSYLDEFNKWQSTIPERCWIEDYYRKYIRPYEVYNTDMFEEMHNGGKKTYQRKQYETYQNYYISSKYFGSTCKSNHFVLRPNGDDLSTFKIPVTLYADCYIHGAFGSGTENPNFTKRCKRNTLITMISPIKNATDATTYLYPANLYQSLGDKSAGLNKLLLEQFNAAGANKLRTLALSVRESDENHTLSSLGIASCENLEELYIAKMKSPSLGIMNLEWAPNIRLVDASDSAFTGFTIADNAPLRVLRMNNPTILTLSNLTELETLIGTANLTDINITNIDNSSINSKDNIVDIAGNKLKDYKLINVNWLINIKATVNGENEIDTTNHTVRVLELLRNVEINTAIPHALRLTGVLTIDGDVYNNNGEAFNANESIKIYNKYITSGLYPKLDIVFTGEQAALPLIKIYNGDNEACWIKRIAKNSVMDEDFLSTGPYGSFNLNMITKQPSTSATYIFEKQWEVYNTDGEKIGTIDNEQPIYTGQVTQDIILKPVFSEKIRQYTLTFYDYNPATDAVDKEMTTITVDWGTKLSDVVPTELPWKPDSADYSYREGNNFVGYGLTPKSTTPVDMNSYTINNNQEFYAIFERVSDIGTIVHYDWFKFIPTSYTSGTNTIQGYSIGPKMALKGKITIPAYYNNLPVITVGRFGEATGSTDISHHRITHIFTETNKQNDYQIITISNSAFNCISTLQYCDILKLSSVLNIEGYAFRNCALREIPFSVASQVKTIGDYAFNGASISLTGTDMVTAQELFIPSSVQKIGEHGFSYMRWYIEDVLKGGAGHLKIGTANNLSQLNEVYNTSFNQNSGFKFKEAVIYHADATMDFLNILAGGLTNDVNISRPNLQGG